MVPCVVENTFYKILQAMVEAPAVQGGEREAGAGGALRKESLKGVGGGAGEGDI